jgi:bifunctional non-homologous end joining protein LigD
MREVTSLPMLRTDIAGSCRSRVARKRTSESRVHFKNLEKVFFPGNGFTKGDMVKYYIEISPAILPHFRDRPVTRIRMPDGVRGERFYEKNAPGYAPDWIPRTQVPRVEGGVINYIMIQDAETLAWIANDAAVELHPFLHRADDISQPTHMAFDLDPGEGADLLTCIEVGWLLREVLDGLGLNAFPKVTGSKGLQLYVPLNLPVTYASVTPFAKSIAEKLSRAHPDLIVSNMLKALRVKKVLIDWSQNHEKKTTVGPYSVRGKRDEPFVSMPVTWDELRRVQKSGRIDSLFFAPADALKRFKKLGDLFAPVLEVKQRLPKEYVLETPARRKVASTLHAYAEKRDFGKTAEPAPDLPKRSAQGSRRRFVIQKHAASHLHYDLRLESGNTLKSWAVPKGMPLKTDERRSAFATEDHPVEYLDFEGTIAEGEYGGGTVMVWDIGTFDTMEGHYWKGTWKVYLTGKKLRGEWTLQKVDDAANPSRWVLTKMGANHKPISAKLDDSSALTNRTLAQIARDNDAQWDSGKPVAEAKTTSIEKLTTKRGSKSSRRDAGKNPAPDFVEPMAAKEVAELPDDGKWIYEIKLDGYRALGIKHGDNAHLISRNEKSLAKDFPGVVSALQTINADSALLDGEIVALDGEGRPSFQLLQNRKSAANAIVYYAFDLLNFEGEDWRLRPLEERKTKLAELIAGSEVRLSASFDGPADKIVAAVEEMQLEGVIAKRRGSVYEPGERSGAWVKFKLTPEQEFVIGGFKRGSPLESLVVGYYKGGKLICAGKVRQGLNPKNRRELHAALMQIAADVCPFANLPNSKKSHWGEGITAAQMKEIQWVIPKVVAQVSFTEWTSGGNLRHATFKGIRADKKPKEVVRELAFP